MRSHLIGTIDRSNIGLLPILVFVANAVEILTKKQQQIIDKNVHTRYPDLAIAVPADIQGPGVARPSVCSVLIT